MQLVPGGPRGQKETLRGLDAKLKVGLYPEGMRNAFKLRQEGWSEEC